MNKVLSFLACLMALILATPSMAIAQSSPTEARLFELYQLPDQWPQFDQEFLASRALSLGEFSRLHQLNGFRWLAASDTERAYRSFARAVIADGGVASGIDRIAPLRRGVYEQFRASIPRAVGFSILGASRPRRYFVDPITIRVEAPSSISIVDVASVQLEICRRANWVNPRLLPLTNGPLGISVAQCGGRVVTKNLPLRQATHPIFYQTTLLGNDWAGIADGSNFAIVSFRNRRDQVQSVWNLDVTVDSPLGLSLPGPVQVPRMRPEMKAVRGWRSHKNRFVVSLLATVLGIVGVAIQPIEIWDNDYDCDSGHGQMHCTTAAIGLTTALVGGVLLATSPTWDGEAPHLENVAYNASAMADYKRAKEAASRMLAEMRRRTMITVTPGERLSPTTSDSRDPAGGN